MKRINTTSCEKEANLGKYNEEMNSFRKKEQYLLKLLSKRDDYEMSNTGNNEGICQNNNEKQMLKVF
jgi:hypothetical protein